MKRAEEIHREIIQLESDCNNELKLCRYETSAHEIQIKYQAKQLKLLTTWKEDICKKQREAIKYHIMEEFNSDYGTAGSLTIGRQRMKDLIESSPEPT